MKKFIAVMTTAALLLSALLAFVPAFAETKTASKGITVPNGYDPNCYLKLRAFLETKDKNGVKNGDKLWTAEEDEVCDENTYNPNNPETWVLDMEDDYTGIYWYQDSSGTKKVEGVYLCFADGSLVGELDLSGMENINQVSLDGSYDNHITKLNTDGCDIKCLYFREGDLRNIDWHCKTENINIKLKSSGEGFVGVDYDNGKFDNDYENAHWCAYARPVQGKQFLGWYDNNGNCVGTELRYEFAVISLPANEFHWAPSPTGSHLNLEARFKTNSAESPAGDYDCNGIVNVQDAILTLRAAMGLITPSGQSLLNTDMDNNRTLTVTDAIIVLRKAMGLV